MTPLSAIALVAVGNPMRGDDGVGAAVVEQLSDRLQTVPDRREVRVHIVDGEPTRIVSAISGADLAIIIDACRTDDPPGTVVTLEVETAGQLADHAVLSSHGAGLAEAIGLAEALDRVPDRLVVIAISGSAFDLGSGLSESVDRAVPLAARAALAEVSRYEEAARPSADRSHGWHPVK